MLGSGRRFSVFPLVAAAVFAATFAAACTTSSSSEPPPSSPDGGDGSDGSAKSTSCDPLEPREQDPEIFIGPTGLKQKLLSLIASATTSLDILIYEIDDTALIDALIAAKARGVAVRMVIDRNNLDPAKAKLVAAGVEVHDSPAVFPYAHSKAMLIDKTRSVIMSANMNAYSLKRERNYGAVSYEAGEANDLAKIFEADFAGRPSNLELGCSKLLVAPLNARARLLNLIASTQSTLAMSVMYLTDNALLEATLARAAAGVDTRIILADPGWIASNDRTARKFAAAKVPVRYMKDLDCHAKLVVSDHRAFVGSENFSSNSVDANREIGIIVTNAPSVAPVEAQFEADWQGAVAAP